MNSQFKFPTTRIIFLSIPNQNQIKWKRIDLIKNGFTQAEFIFSIKRFGLFVFVFVFDHNGMHGYSSYQFSVSFRACCYLKILKCFPQSVEMIFFLQIVWKIILLRTEKKFKKGGGGGMKIMSWRQPFPLPLKNEVFLVFLAFLYYKCNYWLIHKHFFLCVLQTEEVQV